MEELRRALAEYKEATDKLVSFLELEDYDMLDAFLDKREEIIEYIKALQYSSEELREIYDELDISSSEDRLRVRMDIKRKEIMVNMQKSYSGRSANESYIKKAPADAFFFNKKI